MGLPKNKKLANGMVQLNTSVPITLKKNIQKLAIDQNIAMTELVAKALSDYLASVKTAEGKPPSA